MYVYVYVCMCVYLQRLPLKGFPPRRHSHSAVVYQDSMYVFGGIGLDSERYNDIHRFDFQKEVWSPVMPRGATPEGRWGHCGRLCVCAVLWRSL
jgi:N-acetylneuraminic acid mutarotase